LQLFFFQASLVIPSKSSCWLRYSRWAVLGPNDANGKFDPNKEQRYRERNADAGSSQCTMCTFFALSKN
jgi:hypothetical protein